MSVSLKDTSGLNGPMSVTPSATIGTAGNLTFTAKNDGTIDHELLLRAIRKHVTCTWALLYIERWLVAPMMQENGTVVVRDRGTPQGGALHYRRASTHAALTGLKCPGEVRARQVVHAADPET